MIQNIISGVIATLISATIVSLAKRAYTAIENIDTSSKPKKMTPKKTLYREFLCYLFSFVAFFALAIGIPSDVSFGFTCLKTFSALISGFAFLFVWGCFDAAFAFYPPDDAVEMPANSSTNDNPNSDE